MSRFKALLIAAAIFLVCDPSHAGTAYDGNWSGLYICRSKDTQFNMRVRAVVENDRVQATGEPFFGPGTLELSGSIGPDSRIKLEGSHRNPNGNGKISFAGTFAAGKLEAQGSFAGSPTKFDHRAPMFGCTLTLQAIFPAPNSLQWTAIQQRETEVATNIDVLSKECVIPTGTSSSVSDDRPAMYLFAVGINRYREDSLNLRFAAKDACDIAKVLAEQSGGIYKEVQVRVVQDEQATREQILDGLEWITHETTARDLAFVFIAGHGINDATGEYFFIPHDASLARIGRTGISGAEIRRYLLQVPGKAMVFLDTCQSGGAAGKRSVPNVQQVVRDLSLVESSVTILSATTGNQFAAEDQRWSNGAFTSAIIEGLSGKADFQKDGVITANELEVYVSQRVKTLTKGKQAPTAWKPSSMVDYPIALLR